MGIDFPHERLSKSNSVISIYYEEFFDGKGKVVPLQTVLSITPCGCMEEWRCSDTVRNLGARWWCMVNVVSCDSKGNI
jgi:hypothetical protein